MKNERKRKWLHLSRGNMFSKTNVCLIEKGRHKSAHKKGRDKGSFVLFSPKHLPVCSVVFLFCLTPDPTQIQTSPGPHATFYQTPDLKYRDTCWLRVSLYFYVWWRGASPSLNFNQEWQKCRCFTVKKHNKCSVALAETSAISKNWEKSVEFWHWSLCEGLFSLRKKVISWGCRGRSALAFLLSGGCKGGDPACGTARARGNTL